ncbi:hypothetical protein [Aureimonas glaciei]|uniref:Uncharacterized protein n=1 Tax=Aureimonas glaciei TaxID=1776957 RepID=A0A916Y2H7_9HYPH|nr:hypothetical protein [Aureimonas glaciei]GGD27785.1 hypothetical protein GCM10011335_33600 [Aureimonas glaciei]
MSRMDPEEARQGRKGTPVLRILIIALLLCVVAAAGMAVYGSMQPDDDLPAGRVGTGDGATPSADAPADATSSGADDAAGTPAGTSPAATPPATAN